MPRVGKGSVFFACVSVVTARRRAIARRAALQSPTPWLAPLPPPATTEVSFQGNQCFCRGEAGWVTAGPQGRRSCFPRTPLLPHQNWLEEFGTRSGVFISHLGYERGDWGSALLLVPVCTHLASPAAPCSVGRSRVAVGCPGSLSGECFLDYQGLLCTTSLSALLRSLRAWCYDGYCPHFTDGETEAPRGETKARKTQDRHWNLNLCSRS